MIVLSTDLYAIKWRHFVLQLGTAPCITAQYSANGKSLRMRPIAPRCILVQRRVGVGNQILSLARMSDPQFYFSPESSREGSVNNASSTRSKTRTWPMWMDILPSLLGWLLASFTP